MQKMLFMGIICACMSMPSLAESGGQAAAGQPAAAVEETQVTPKLVGGGKPLKGANGVTATGNGSSWPSAGGTLQAVSVSRDPVLQFNPKK